MCKLFIAVIFISVFLFQTIIALPSGIPITALIEISYKGMNFQVKYLKNAKNNKNTAIIKPNECNQILFPLLELTEVCSSGGGRLYFNPYDTEIRGCYTMGKANTATFADCCQLRYNPVNGAAPGTIYYKEFCSGRREKSNYKNPGEMNKYGIDRSVNDLRLMEATVKVYEDCEANYNRNKCDAAEDKEKKVKNASVNWNSALSIWRYKNGITKVYRKRDNKFIKEIRE